MSYVIIINANNNIDRLAKEFVDDVLDVFDRNRVCSATIDELRDMATSTYLEDELDYMALKALLRSDDVKYLLAVD